MFEHQDVVMVLGSQTASDEQRAAFGRREQGGCVQDDRGSTAVVVEDGAAWRSRRGVQSWTAIRSPSPIAQRHGRRDLEQPSVTLQAVLQPDWRRKGAKPAWVAALGLPPRLAQVAACLTLGDSAQQMAGRLGLTPSTVRSYVKNLYQSLGVGGRVEAATRVLEALRAPQTNASLAGASASLERTAALWAPRLGLPPRLTRVAACVALGLSDKQTAARLGLSQHTVRSYLKEIYATLGLRGRTDVLLAVEAVRSTAVG